MLKIKKLLLEARDRIYLRVKQKSVQTCVRQNYQVAV